MINSITEEITVLLPVDRNFLNQMEESRQLNDFPTLKVTCYYFEDCQKV